MNPLHSATMRLPHGHSHNLHQRRLHNPHPSVARRVQTRSTHIWQACSPLATAMGLIRSETLVHSGMPPVPSPYGYVSLMSVRRLPPVASVKVSMASLPHKRRALCRRTASIRLHSSSSSNKRNNNKHIITSSHSFPFECIAFAWFGGLYVIFFFFPTLNTIPIPCPSGLALSPLTLPFSLDLAGCKYYL